MADLSGPAVCGGAQERVGYVSGVFDLFHVGHLRLLERARQHCGSLVVAVATDELLQKRGRPPVVPALERMLVVQGVRHVDLVVPQTWEDEALAWEQLRFDVLFFGDSAPLPAEPPEHLRRLLALGIPAEQFTAGRVHPSGPW